MAKYGQLHARLAVRGTTHLTWLVVLAVAANAPGAASKIAANFIPALRCAWRHE
jgi:hypothetical protein